MTYIRIQTLVATASVVVLMTGCGSHQESRFSALSQVPPSKLTALKQALQKAPIKNIELPTSIPFTVTSALIQTHTNPAQVTIQLFGKTEFLEVDTWPDPNNTPPSPTTDVMPKEQSTSLPDGSKALYGNNGVASMLDWAQGGVEYSLVSTNAQNKPDLTEEQLVGVANSLK